MVDASVTITGRSLPQLTNEITDLDGTERVYLTPPSGVSSFALTEAFRGFLSPTNTFGILDIDDYEAAGDGATNDTDAFIAAEAALPATGGIILLRAGARYAVNWTVTKSGVHLLGQYGGGDGNVATGFTAFNPALPALTIGNGTTQLRSFNADKIRVYSQTAAKGFLIAGCAFVNLNGCEFGGFTDYPFRVTSSASAFTSYVDCFGCTFFATANTSGDVISLIYGAQFTTAVKLTGCRVLSGAGAPGCKAMRVGDGVEVWVAQTWFEVADEKGIIAEGTGRVIGDGMMVDSEAPTDIVIEWPSTEIYPNSFFQGNMRIDGRGRNSASFDFDLRGVFTSARGFFYGPVIYRPTLYGATQLVDTSAPTQSGPFLVPGGGTPDGVISAEGGSLFLSTSETGSSAPGFLKTQDSVGGDASLGWERIVTGDYYNNTSDNTLISDVTTSIGEENGDFVFVGGTAIIVSFGTAARSGIRRVVEFTDAPTLVHSADIYLAGIRHDVTVISGDTAEFIYQGSGTWRLLWFTPYNGRDMVPV